MSILWVNPTYKEASFEWGAAARAGFSLCDAVTLLTPGSKIIPRYSVLPNAPLHYHHLDVIGVQPINDLSQHSFVANLDYYEVLRHAGISQPLTYFDEGYMTIPDCEQGWVLKGRTNSRRYQWATHMRARTREDVRDVMRKLMDDPLLDSQGIVIREYVPLEPLIEEGHPVILMNGLPVTHEWRFFFLGGSEISEGYYWQPSTGINLEVPEGARELAHRAAQVLKDHVNFFVIDVALTQGGEYLVIEVNDGQQSGLNGYDADRFYANLYAALNS